jgi:hypothetical protein
LKLPTYFNAFGCRGGNLGEFAMAKKPTKKAMIVIEGDSWEHLPDWGLKALPIVGGSNYDLSRALNDLGYPILNIAYWGDTIDEISKRLDCINALKSTGAEYMRLGGGGNDLLHDGNLRHLIALYERDRPPEEYLKPAFEIVLNRVVNAYDTVLTAILAHKIDVTVLIHGYDYARPMQLGWLGEPMSFMGIDDPNLQQDIVNVMMNRFNFALAEFAPRWKNVRYVDLRGTVGTDWHDELHPNKVGFKKVAKKISAALTPKKITAQDSVA